MSLYNHELSVVWRRRCRRLWTVLQATSLITETSYLTHEFVSESNVCF